MKNAQGWKRREVLSSMLKIGAGLAFPFLSPQARADTISDAKQENGFMLYSGAELTVNMELLAAFQKQYPFVKQPKLVRSGGPATIERIEAEYRTGRVHCDVLLTGGSIWHKWVEERKIMKYESPEYKNYPAEYKVDGYFVAIRASSMTLASNTQRVAKADQPRRYQDLLKPNFKGGMIGMPDPRRSSQGRAWYTVTRHYLGRDFMVKLAQQKPLVVRGGGDLINRLISGEVAVAVQTSDRAITAKRKGAPVELAMPAEGVVLMPSYAGIMAKAPHPATAKLFMEFIMSVPALEILAVKAGYHMLRRGTASIPDLPSISALKTWEFDEKKIGALTNEISKEFTDLFT